MGGVPEGTSNRPVILLVSSFLFSLPFPPFVDRFLETGVGPGVILNDWSKSSGTN